MAKTKTKTEKKGSSALKFIAVVVFLAAVAYILTSLIIGVWNPLQWKSAAQEPPKQEQGNNTGNTGNSGNSGNTGNGNNSGNTGTPEEGNDEETIKEWAITWEVTSNNAEELIHISVDIPEKAVAGEKVAFVAQLLSDYDCEIERIDIYVKGAYRKLGQATNDGNCTYSFLMPECDIRLDIVISDIDVESEYTISYSSSGAPYPEYLNFYCETAAKPGDLVTVSISCPDNTYEISRVDLQNENGEFIKTLTKFNELYEFTMPEHNVNVCVYLKSTARAISYGAYLLDDMSYDISSIFQFTCDTNKAYAGQTITFTVLTTTPGYKLSDIYIGVPGIDIRLGEVTSLGNSTYTFVMPDYEPCIWLIYELVEW